MLRSFGEAVPIASPTTDGQSLGELDDDVDNEAGSDERSFTSRTRHVANRLKVTLTKLSLNSAY